MNNCKHLKNKKVLIQLSDGSSLRLNCYFNKKDVKPLKSKQIVPCGPN